MSIDGSVNSEQFVVDPLVETPKLEVNLEIKNEGPSSKSYCFTSGCLSFTEIKDSQDKVIRSTKFELACTLALSNLILNPGQSQKFSHQFEPVDLNSGELLPHGQYTITTGLLEQSGIERSFEIELVSKDQAVANLPSLRIVDGKYNAETGKVDLDITYGGCKEHAFELKMGDVCAESIPAYCSAKLVHTKGADDFCEALISETISLDVDLQGPAYLTIEGAEDFSVQVLVK